MKGKLLALLFLALLAAGIFLWRHQRANPLLGPALALEKVAGAESLYFTQPLKPDQNDERASMFAQAALDPRYWRQLDRRFRFDVALLVGDPAVYRPLLEHLSKSADWILSYLDHASVVFRRAPAQAWDPETLQSLADGFTLPSQKTEFYVQAAGRLLALNDLGHARACLEKALALDPQSVEAWTQYASLEVRQRQWEAGTQKVDKALAGNPGYRPAQMVKAQILLATRRPGDAFGISRTLLKDTPENGDVLLLHARAAHGVRAYREEIQALQKIISLAEKNRQSAAAYRVYLGQALSADGQTQPALEQFQKALDDPDLGEAERSFARQAVDRLRPATAQ